MRKRNRLEAVVCGSLSLTFVLACLLSAGSWAKAVQDRGVEGRRVIYGNDDRVDAQLHSNADFRKLSLSVAGRISKSEVSSSDTGLILPSRSLAQAMNVCTTERFATQKAAVQCTGFLVAADLLVTAGHCMETVTDCENNHWIFGFVDGVSEIKKEDVYSCKEIVSQELNSNNDFAVVRLDRPVQGREALKLRRQGDIQSTDKVLVIGHPSGLPLKINDHGTVRDPSSTLNYFVAELDTYGGNSGSPVFNEATLEVEGILVRGERDYVWNPLAKCAVSNVCSVGICRGEDVQKITKVTGLPN